MATQQEKNKYYYPYLIGKRQLHNIEKVKFIKYLKHLFYNERTYKWIPTKYKLFVKKNNLNFNDVYSVLSNLNISNNILKEKGYSDFLKKIENYNKKEKQLFKVKEGVEDRTKFLIGLEKLRSDYLKINRKQLVNLITDNFDIGYTKSTLLKKFYEKEFD